MNTLNSVRRNSARRMAFRLADSGCYDDWKAIEPTLCIHFGFLEVRRLLIDRTLCLELNRHCVRAHHDENSASRSH